MRKREGQLTKPAGSLGRLEEISGGMAAWQGSARPHVDHAVFAGNHGVVAQGVSAFPASVTQAMVANFQAGGAAINQICKAFDLSLKVYELALEKADGGSALDGAGAATILRDGGRHRARPARARRDGHRQYDQRRQIMRFMAGRLRTAGA